MTERGWYFFMIFDFMCVTYVLSLHKTALSRSIAQNCESTKLDPCVCVRESPVNGKSALSRARKIKKGYWIWQGSDLNLPASGAVSQASYCLTTDPDRVTVQILSFIHYITPSLYFHLIPMLSSLLVFLMWSHVISRLPFVAKRSYLHSL